MVADQRDFVVTGREVNVEPYNGSVAIVLSPPPSPMPSNQQCDQRVGLAVGTRGWFVCTAMGSPVPQKNIFWSVAPRSSHSELHGQMDTKGQNSSKLGCSAHVNEHGMT